MQDPVESLTLIPGPLSSRKRELSVVSTWTDSTHDESHRTSFSEHDETDDSDCESLEYHVVESVALTPCTNGKSILKEPEGDWAFIRTEGPWKRMCDPLKPARPFKEIKPTKPCSQKRSVTFDSVQIRQYKQTLGDNPSCSYGPPVQLDWHYYEDEEVKVPINEFECRERKWKFRPMVLNYYQRKSLLTFYYGFTDEELEQQSQIVQKVRRQRYWTKVLERVYVLEDVFSSAYRRVKIKFASKKKKNSRQNDVPSEGSSHSAATQKIRIEASGMLTYTTPTKSQESTRRKRLITADRFTETTNNNS